MLLLWCQGSRTAVHQAVCLAKLSSLLYADVASMQSVAGACLDPLSFNGMPSVADSCVVSCRVQGGLITHVCAWGHRTHCLVASLIGWPLPVMLKMPSELARY